jgi:histone H3/H4
VLDKSCPVEESENNEQEKEGGDNEAGGSESYESENESERESENQSERGSESFGTDGWESERDNSHNLGMSDGPPRDSIARSISAYHLCSHSASSEISEVGGTYFEEIGCILKSHLEQLFRDVTTLTEFSRRKTVLAQDVLAAIVLGQQAAIKSHLRVSNIKYLSTPAGLLATWFGHKCHCGFCTLCRN